MFILALFCLLAAVGSQAKPLQPVVEPAQHIVIVTPQAQVHLEPAVRYVHGLSPLARVSGPHHEETIVYVPAGTAASVLPNVVSSDAVGTGRARSPYQIAEGKQIEGIPSNINEIQQQAAQNIQIATGQFTEAAAAAAATGAGFFPGFFPSNTATKDEQKSDKIELIETPANTQPLIAATEARHFYSLPQVYHTPVVDVVHGPVYTWPISAIRARSIEPKEAPLLEIEQKPEAALEAAAPAAAIAPELPEAQPLLKEQKLSEPQSQPLEKLATNIEKVAEEFNKLKPEIAARQLEESNAIKPELISAELPKENLKEAPKEAILESIPAALPEAPKEEITKQPLLEEPTSPLKAIPIPEAIVEAKAQATSIQPESPLKAIPIPEAIIETKAEASPIPPAEPQPEIDSAIAIKAAPEA
ncbi:hypothetical protein KR044_003304 [Drosophila immigrans]|nr:hypothetical protein KR044_003304 [Drosophila immigrans]